MRILSMLAHSKTRNGGKKTAQECKTALISHDQTLLLYILVVCPFFLFVFSSRHNSVQMSEGSQVSKVSLCVKILNLQSESQSVSRKVGTSYGAAPNLFADLPPGGTISNFLLILSLSLDVGFVTRWTHLCQFHIQQAPPYCSNLQLCE